MKFDKSKTPARLALPLAFTLFAVAPAAAQSKPSAAWEITDNSFLVEEAFNQEAGVVQNIMTWTRGRDGVWESSFTQEWPAPGMTHQLSYTLSYLGDATSHGFSDTYLNYRFQLRKEDASGPAIAPRISLVLPTGGQRTGDTTGFDLNLPVSKQFGNVYVHGNLGYTWVPDVQRTTHVAGSGIWRLAPMLNLMLEAVVDVGESVTLSPGFRRGFNFGEKQLVLGVAVPVTRADGRSTAALLTYFSYELPFRQQP